MSKHWHCNLSVWPTRLTQSTTQPVVKVVRRIRWHYSDYTVTVLCFRIGARQHEVSKLYGTLVLSAGTLMASAGTQYRLVPAYFYPGTQPMHQHTSTRSLTSRSSRHGDRWAVDKMSVWSCNVALSTNAPLNWHTWNKGITPHNNKNAVLSQRWPHDVT